MDVHRIQAHTAWGYKGPSYDVHHIDENTLNNALSNLDYTMTHSEHISKTMKVHAKGNKNRLGTCHSEESKKKMSEIKKGKTTWIKGKHHSDDVKKRLSEISKGNHYALGYHHSDEAKKKMSEAKKGRTLWNNGKECKLSKESPGEGWIKGRIHHIKL